ncbi:hypothetical protein C7212DRAFT_167645, partial [Tuber magnatum]
ASRYASVRLIPVHAALTSPNISEVSKDKGEEQGERVNPYNSRASQSDMHSCSSAIALLPRRPQTIFPMSRVSGTCYKAFLCICISETRSSLLPKLFLYTRIMLAAVG